MFRGFRWLALAGVVATAALVGPSAALACDGSGSAVSIYTQCVPKASGGHPSKHPHTSAGSQTPYVAPYAVPVHVSHKTAHTIARAGKDKKVLNNLVHNPDLVDADHINPMLVAAPAKATALGSAFDLGVGPTILFVLLLGTVLAVFGTGSVRAWRNRHRV